MQDVFGRDGLGPDAALRERDVLGYLRIQMMTNHKHIEMLGDGIHRVWTRRVGRRWEHMRQGRDTDDVRCMAAARAFRVIGVNGTVRDGRYGLLNETGFVNGIGVYRDLNVELIRNTQAHIDR